MSYEDYFMEKVRYVPIEYRDQYLDDIIYSFIDSEGYLELIEQMKLSHEQSENFGCTVKQVACDVIRHHLEQHFLKTQEYWYVVEEKETGMVDVIESVLPGHTFLAGPFETYDRAYEELEKITEEATE